MYSQISNSGSQLSKVTQSEFNAQLIQLWLGHNKSKHTRRVYSQDIKEFLQFVGDLPLNQVTYLETQEFRESLASRKLAPRTINRKIHALRSLLTFGCEKVRMLPTNVGVVLGSEPVKNDLAQRILSEEQVFKMFALEENQRNALILRTLYYTGLRVSEICSLTWKDLQPRSEYEGQVTVFGKGGKTRVVLVSEKVWRSLLELRGEAGKDDPVFVSNKGGHLDSSQVFRIVRAAGNRAGIENVSPHWLRHSHASHSMDRGAPLHVVQASLGHSNPATTGRYLHARPGDGSGRYLG
uniref:Integrase n=1 Tax=Oscillatoriales cyanobacterium SpSt-402 TaxID=2282168 RepID=A0A832H200_9CYAN